MRETGERSRTGVVPPEGLRPPQGLNAAMEGLAREVLLKTPTDIFAFAAEYFENLIRMREQFSFDGKPTDIQNLVSANLKNIENTGKISQNDKNSSTLANNKYKNQKQAKSFDSKSNINLYLKRQNSNLKSKSLENSIFLMNEKHLHDVEDPLKSEKKKSSSKIEDDDCIKDALPSEENITQKRSETVHPAAEPLMHLSAEGKDQTEDEKFLHGETTDKVDEIDDSDQNSLINEVNNIPANDKSTKIEDTVVHKTISFIEEESKQNKVSKENDLDHQESSNVDITPNEKNDVLNTGDQDMVVHKMVVDNTSSLFQEEIKLHDTATKEPGEISESIVARSEDSQHEETLSDTVILNESNEPSNVKEDNLQESTADNIFLAEANSKPDETINSLDDNNGTAENSQKNHEKTTDEPLTSDEQRADEADSKDDFHESSTVEDQDDSIHPTLNQEIDSQKVEKSSTIVKPDSEVLTNFNENIENLHNKINESNVNIDNLEESTKLTDDIISINKETITDNISSSRKKRSISVSESDLESNIEIMTPNKSEDMPEESTIEKIDTKENSETSAISGRNTTTDENILGEILSGDEINITKETHTENEISKKSDGNQNEDFKSENEDTALDTEKLILENNVTEIVTQDIHTEEIIKPIPSVDNISADAHSEPLNDDTISMNVVKNNENEKFQKEEKNGSMNEEGSIHEDDIHHNEEKNLLSDENNGSVPEKHGESIQHKQVDSVEIENSKIKIQNDNEDSILDDKDNSGNDRITHEKELDILDHNQKSINTSIGVGVEETNEQINKSIDENNDLNKILANLKPEEDDASPIDPINKNNEDNLSNENKEEFSRNLSNDAEDGTKKVEEKRETDIEIQNTADEENDKFEKASIVIQRNYRGYRVRKNLKIASDENTGKILENLSDDTVDDTNKIKEKHEIDIEKEPKEDDKNIKEIQNSTDEENADLVKASIVIQRNYRGYRVRKNLKAASDENTDEITKNISDDAGYDTNKIEEKSDIDIEKEPKDDDIKEIQNSIDEENGNLEKASIVIQRNYRGYQVRKSLKAASDENSDEITKNISDDAGYDTNKIEEKSDIDIEKEPKDDDIKEIQNSTDEENGNLEKASIVIQRNYRGYQVRKSLKAASDENSDEITKNLSDDAGYDTNKIEEKSYIDIEKEPKDDDTKEIQNSTDEENGNLEKASIVIQRNYRGYQVRKSLKAASDENSDEITKNLSDAAGYDTNKIEEKSYIDIEKEPKDDDIKEIQNSTDEENGNLEKASIVIQRNYRGYQVRKSLKAASDENSDEKNISDDADDDTNKIEDKRDIDIEKEPKDNNKSTKQIQNSTDEENGNLEKASIVIQRNYRGYRVRKKLKEVSNKNIDEISKNLSDDAGNGTNKIEEKNESDIENELNDDDNNIKEKKSTDEENGSLEKASIVIQRNYRGYQARKSLKTASDENTDEITKNLSDDTNKIEEKHQFDIEKETNNDDKNIKEIKNPTDEENGNLEKASIVIQRNYRGYQVRKSLKAASDEDTDENTKNLTDDATGDDANINEEKREISIENEPKVENVNIIETLNSANEENHTFEKASILIQKVFRGFQVRKTLLNPVKKRTESEDQYKKQEVTNNEAVKNVGDALLGESNELVDEEFNGDTKRADNLLRTLSYQAAMDNTLYTVSEERNSYSTDEESSTFSSAATKIQAGVRGYLTRKYLRNKTGTSSDTTAPSIGEDSRSLDDLGNAGEPRVSTDDNVHKIMEETSNILIDQADRADKLIPGINLIEANKESEESTSRPNQNRKRLRREDAIQLHSPYSSGETPNNKQASKASEDEEPIGDLAQSIITEIESDTYTPIVEIKHNVRSPTTTPLQEPLNSEDLNPHVKSLIKMEKEHTFEIIDKNEENKDKETKNIPFTDVGNMHEKYTEVPELNLNFDDDNEDGKRILSPDLEKLKKLKDVEIKEEKDRKVLPRYISSEVETLVSKHTTEHIDDAEDQLEEMPTSRDADNKHKRSNRNGLEMLEQTTEDNVTGVTEPKSTKANDDLSTIKGILHSGEFHDTIVLPTKVERKLSIQKGKSSSR